MNRDFAELDSVHRSIFAMKRGHSSACLGDRIGHGAPEPTISRCSKRSQAQSPSYSRSSQHFPSRPSSWGSAPSDAAVLPRPDRLAAHRVHHPARTIRRHPSELSDASTIPPELPDTVAEDAELMVESESEDDILRASQVEVSKQQLEVAKFMVASWSIKLGNHSYAEKVQEDIHALAYQLTLALSVFPTCAAPSHTTTVDQSLLETYKQVKDTMGLFERAHEVDPASSPSDD